jgi:hypothetical protein
MNKIAVSYWTGNLPSISNLHFTSFKFNNSNFKYVLYLDNDISNLPTIPEDLIWLLNEPWFELRYFSLTEMMSNFEIEPFSKWSNTLFSRMCRRVRLYMLKVALILNKKYNKLFKNAINNHYNAEVGFSFSHNQKFTGLYQHLTYRSDVFRSLIAHKYPNDDVMYVDLDICFVKPFDKYDWGNAFSSPWGLGKFANTAILFLPSKNQLIRKKILFEFKEISAAWPWVLYSEVRCKKYGLQLRKIEEFDPAWAPKNPNTGESNSFMEKRSNSQEIVDWIDRHSFCVHWHNQWSVLPEPGSPYYIYFNRFKL